MRSLNRNTTLVAAGLLGPVVFAAVMVALREPHQKGDDLTGEPKQAGNDMSLNTNPAALPSVAWVNEKTTGEIISKQATSVDRGFTPEANHPPAQANASSWSPAHWQDSAQVVRPKILNLRHRSSMRSRIVGVKMRLIALWHQSLARTERSSTWTLFSDKGTIETSH
jgi:hypothetical protein